VSAASVKTGQRVPATASR